MSIHNGATDLHARVERYEAAVDELRAAHQDVKDVLVDHVLYERWQRIGAELGYVADEAHSIDTGQLHRHPSDQSLAMSDSWSG